MRFNVPSFAVLAILAAPALAPAQTSTATVTASYVLDGRGNTLSSGELCFGATCLPVVNGAVSNTTPVPQGTANLSVIEGHTVFTTIQNVSVSGSTFSYDAFVLGTSQSATGPNQPYLPCTSGARYAQTSPNVAWTCSASNAWVIAGTGTATASAATSANLYAANGITQADAVTHSTAYGLQTFGDSLTAGLGATTTANAWPNLMAAHFGITSGFVNHGQGGDRAMDMTAKIFNALNPGDFGNPIVTGWAGANEVVGNSSNVPAGAATLAAYTKNLYAAAIWAGVSSKWKAFMQNTALVNCSGGISTGQTNYFNPNASGVAQQSVVVSSTGAIQGYSNQQFGGYFTASDYMTVTAGTSYATNLQTCFNGQSCGYA